MKKFLILLLKWTIKKLAQFTLWKYKPRIVGVTGAVGKTSTKEAIATILQEEYLTRASSANFNNELGLPLTILGSWKKVGVAFFWLRVILASTLRLLFRTRYPEVLVLEYGVDKPGDMKYLLQIAKPNVGVVTAIGEIPAHVEFFSSPEEVAREKRRIIEGLSVADHAILNIDDEIVKSFSEHTRAQIATYGFAEEADVRITSYEYRIEGDKPLGISFKLEYKGSIVPVRLDNVFGRAQAYAAAAAAAVGLVYEMNLVHIAEALEKYRPLGHRMALLKGEGNTLLIDDAYNANPLSMKEALTVLEALPGKRKVAVLGDMLEIGEYAMGAHEKTGAEAAKFLDVLIAVGPRAKFIAEGAKKSGMSGNNIYKYDTAEEATKEIMGLLKPGDLVLVKGSRAIGLETVVEELKAF